MLGAVAGDIIGSPYRWNNTNDRYFELCRGSRGWSHGREVTFHPKFTGATVMTLAVARWLMSDKDRSAARLVRTMQTMGRQYIESGFPVSQRSWLLKENPIPTNSGSNATAMRVSPIAMIDQSLPETLAMARMTAQVSQINPEAVKGAEALAQAIWMARHGRSKDDICFAMTHDFGYDLSIQEEDMRSMLMGAIKEPIIVNGVDTGECYFRETGKVDNSSQTTITAALQAFLAGDSFEDVVRRAVALGGDSNTIASMAGAVAAPFYGGVPEKISGLCDVYLNGELRSLMSLFENVCMQRKAAHPIKIEHRQDDSFKVIRLDDRKIYVVESYRKELIQALKDRFGDCIEIIKPSQALDVIQELSKQHMDGTYLEKPLPDVRTIYYQEGEFRTSATMSGGNLPSKELRLESRRDFLEIHDYALKVKQQIQYLCGYHGNGSIHFQNAYYPRIYSERVEIWKGDIFAGSVGIDSSSGLLKINAGGDFGPMEWFGERTESVFNSVSIDSIKESIGRFCLDEGIGICDAKRTLNLETANRDVAQTKDTKLLDAIDNTTIRQQSIKR